MTTKIEFDGESIEQIHTARDGQRFGYVKNGDKYRVTAYRTQIAMCSVHHGSINSGQATQTIVKDFRGKVIYSGVRDND